MNFVRNNKVEQANIPAIQQYKRDLTNCDPVRAPSTTWMCPSCDHIHVDVPPYKAIFFQCECGWFGNEDDLVLARQIEDY